MKIDFKTMNPVEINAIIAKSEGENVSIQLGISDNNGNIIWYVSRENVIKKFHDDTVAGKSVQLRTREVTDIDYMEDLGVAIGLLKENCANGYRMGEDHDEGYWVQMLNWNKEGPVFWSKNSLEEAICRAVLTHHGHEVE